MKKKENPKSKSKYGKFNKRTARAETRAEQAETRAEARAEQTEARAVVPAEQAGRAEPTGTPTGEPEGGTRLESWEYHRLIQLGKQRLCSRCGQIGHGPRMCRFKQFSCFHCGQLGHIEQMCLQKREKIIYLIS